MLAIQAGTITVDQQNSITVTLKDQNGNPLSSRTVHVAVKGVSLANVTTGSNGQVSFNWSPSITGDYTVAASYGASGSMDTGYMPASASTVVNVQPQTIINTQTTGSGTQSVTFNTAQGSGASVTDAISYSFKFSLSSATVTLQFNGKQTQATISTRNEFGWKCAANVFGECVLRVPYWKLHEDLGLPGLFDLHIASFVPFGPSRVSYDLTLPNPFDDLSAEAGAAASFLIPSVGTAIILVGSAAGGSFDPGIVGAAGLAVAAGILSADLAEATAYFAGFASANSFKSFLIGLLAPMVLGVPCAAGLCPPEIGPLPPSIETANAALYAWSAYFLVGILVSALEGVLAIFCVGLALLLTFLLYSSL